MKKCQTTTLFLAIFLSLSFFSLFGAEETSREEISLWPKIQPFQSDFLKVSNIHKIYYELCGNPKGKPVFVLHGGPGANISPYYRRFFNPKKFLIVLFDQRGCGKSQPFAELRENTTKYLIEDIEKLRKHLKLEKITIFGGSWGSTLGLAYSETYPKNVRAMVLRGIFTATQEELEHYYGRGVEAFFPETYQKLKDVIDGPVSPKLIFEKTQSENPKSRTKYSRAWTSYEIKIAELEISDKEVENLVKRPSLSNLVYSIALLENYYMANGCFLEEGQLLKNTEKIKNIPTILVNGRYDMICPPINAFRLHKKLPKSKLIIVEGAGHSMREKGIEKALLQAMREFE